MTVYKCIIADGPDYDFCYNDVLLQQYKNEIKIVGVLSKYNNIKLIDGIPVVSVQDLEEMEYDYVIVMSIDGVDGCIRDLERYLRIPSSKIVGVSPFREPNFDFEDYVRIKESDLTIIADNCFGGYLYNFLSLQFTSPFINMYFSSSDMLKLMNNPRSYLSMPIIFSHMQDDGNLGSFPVCKLGDLTLYMNHYKDFEDAKRHWDKRVQRVNYDRIVYVLHFNENCAEFREALKVKEKKIIDVGFEFDEGDIPSDLKKYNMINKAFEFKYEYVLYDGIFSLFHNDVARYSCQTSQSMYLTKALNGESFGRKIAQNTVEINLDILTALKSIGKNNIVLYHQLKDKGESGLLDEIEKTIDMSNPHFFHDNAITYLNGKGVERDLNKAAYWMRKAYEQHFWSAPWELFDILWQIGSKESLTEMLDLATKEAESGQRDMQCRLARAYLNGKGVERDLNKAAYWMRKAYEQQLPGSGEELDKINQIIIGKETIE